MEDIKHTDRYIHPEKYRRTFALNGADILFNLRPLLPFALIVALFARGVARGSVPHSFVSREVLECSMFFMLTLLLSPMASRTHFGIMVLPAFCVARDAIYSRDRFSWALLLVSLICSLVSINILRDKSFVEMTFWLGAAMFCALSLFVGCGYLILRPRITKTSQGMVPISA